MQALTSNLRALLKILRGSCKRLHFNVNLLASCTVNHVVWYLDYILVSGKDDEQHLKNLAEVLHQLEKYGLRGRLNFFKIQWNV